MVLEDFGLDLAAWLAKNPRPNMDAVRFLHARLGLQFRAVV